MKVIIYGGKGWIGQKICYLLSQIENIVLLISDARVDDLVSIEQELKSFNATHVVCVIGRTRGTYNGVEYSTIDYLENPGVIKYNVRDNLFSPLALAILTQKLNIHMTYMGTGCIFKYDVQDPEHLFTESDEPNFFGSSYSTVKGYTDRLMHMFDNVLNVRIRMPITSENNNRNFITKITNYKKICSIPNSMTVMDDMLPILVDMIMKNTTGTINLVNPGVIEHNEILQMYKEIVDPNFTWENFTIEEQNEILLSERSNNHLDTSLLEKLYPDVKNIKDAVRGVLAKYFAIANS